MLNNVTSHLFFQNIFLFKGREATHRIISDVKTVKSELRSIRIFCRTLFNMFCMIGLNSLFNNISKLVLSDLKHH